MIPVRTALLLVLGGTASLQAQIGASTSTLNFIRLQGTTVPASRTVSLSGSGSYTSSLSAGSTSWLSVTPVSGTLPATVTVSAAGGPLSGSSYTGNITFSASNTSAQVGVTLNVFATTPQVFQDVPVSSLYLDYIFLLNKLNITVGCNSVPNYCPGDSINQGQMAVFLIRSLLGDDFQASSTPYFTDVPSTNVYFRYVQKMREMNINPGCQATVFCVDSAVTRGQMAQYIIRAKFGESFTTPTSFNFSDVSSSDPSYRYVLKMAEQGFTAGCTTTTYCPADAVKREQMATFIIRAFYGYGVLSTGNPGGGGPTPTPTPPPTPTPTPTPPPPPPPPPGNPPTIAGCPIFPYDNVWNTPVDTLPALTNSWVSTIGLTRKFHADFGAGLWAGGPIGIPFVVVPQNQTKVNVSFEFDDESDPGPYPIPPNPPIEGGNGSGGDRHILILEQGVCKLWELYSAYPQTNGTWTAGSGAIYDLNANGPLRPLTWTSADAAGLPILPGLVRYDEVAAGEIRHAIRFTVPQSKSEFIWPARHEASDLTGSQYPPMGARFRLKASFDISVFPADVQVILKAMKKYGIINADNGSAWYISGVPDERWNNDHLHQFGSIPGSAIEAVDTSSMIVNSNSGQARQP